MFGLAGERKWAMLRKAIPFISERFDSLLGVLDLGHFSFVYPNVVFKPLVFNVSTGLSVPGAAHTVDQGKEEDDGWRRKALKIPPQPHSRKPVRHLIVVDKANLITPHFYM